MQFSDILGALRRRWAFAVVPLVAAVGIGLFSVLTAPVVYQATAQAYVGLPVGTSANDLYQGSNYAQQQLSSYAALATSQMVLDPVIDRLGLDKSARALASDVQATASSETVIMTITARASSGQTAADIANAVTEELTTQVETLPPRLEDGQPSVEIVPMGAATPPSVPVSPDKKRDLAAALLAGLFVGILAALVRDRTDTRVRGRADVPAGVGVLGSIPFDKSVKAAGPASVVGAGSQARGEAYRRVRTTLRFADVDRPAQVFEVTSAQPGEGKSTSALNLAQVFASAGGRVLLVDADLRKPRIADYLGIVGSVGLVDVLIGRARLDDVVQKVLDGRLAVLPCGTIPPNPTELLGSRSMMALTGELRQRYDVVIFDTPPLLPVVDAAVLAPLTDGVILVSRYRKVTRAQLESAVGSLNAVGTRVLGVLLTCVRSVQAHRNAYGDYYREPASARPLRSGRRSAPVVSARKVPAVTASRHMAGRGGREAPQALAVAPRPHSTPPVPAPDPVPSASPPPDEEANFAPAVASRSDWTPGPVRGAPARSHPESASTPPPTPPSFPPPAPEKEKPVVRVREWEREREEEREREREREFQRERERARELEREREFEQERERARLERERERLERERELEWPSSEVVESTLPRADLYDDFDATGSAPPVRQRRPFRPASAGPAWSRDSADAETTSVRPRGWDDDDPAPATRPSRALRDSTNPRQHRSPETRAHRAVPSRRFTD